MNAGERAMLHYARKLTVNRAHQLHALRVAGFSERAILEIDLAAAYMNLVSRIAEGLGIEIDGGFWPLILSVTFCRPVYLPVLEAGLQPQSCAMRMVQRAGCIRRLHHTREVFT